MIHAVTAIWAAAGYPWSVRLKALLPLWLPWARRRLRLSATVCRQLRTISPRQLARRLAPTKRTLKTRRYGRTKPGTWLKHHIPLKTDHWNVTVPGFTELDLVAHPGDRADGEFAHSLNVTDIHTTWGETRAVLGRGESRVQEAVDEIRRALPFRLQGIDSDNGSEFINDHLYRYCQPQGIQFTRGRPYKKDDNAHIEQKNWTHVRKLVGYLRYDTPAAVAALNALYRHELRLFHNLFLPSVKLVRKARVGARLRRRCDAPRTPLQRLQACPAATPATIAPWVALDPFALSQAIDRQIERLVALATPPRSRPTPPTRPAAPATASRIVRRRRPPPPRRLKTPFLRQPATLLYHWHGGTMTRRVPGLLALAPRLSIAIHPDDARRLHVREGDPVRVRSRRGELEGVGQPTDAVRPGEIFVPFVRLGESAANFLTNSAHDPTSKIPEYKVCAVHVERVPTGIEAGLPAGDAGHR